MPSKTAAPRNPFADIAPTLADYTDNVPFGNVWKRTQLSPRDRSLVTVARLVALYRDQPDDTTTYGCVDVLLNNAGLMPLAPLERLKVDEWDRSSITSAKRTSPKTYTRTSMTWRYLPSPLRTWSRSPSASPRTWT